MPEISVFRRLRQEDHEFEISLGHTAKPYLKANKNVCHQRMKPVHVHSYLKGFIFSVFSKPKSAM
jgi:hypothetical protein